MQRNTRKLLEGTVVSSKMDKTLVVLVTRKIPHPVYGKQVERRKKYYAHHEGEKVEDGQVVRIMSTRPISKSKSWRVVEILKDKKLG